MTDYSNTYHKPGDDVLDAHDETVAYTARRQAEHDILYRALTAAGHNVWIWHDDPSLLRQYAEGIGFSLTPRTLVVEKGSQAWRELRAMFNDPEMYKISFDQRERGVALKLNEYTWTPTLDVTAP